MTESPWVRAVSPVAVAASLGMLLAVTGMASAQPAANRAAPTASAAPPTASAPPPPLTSTAEGGSIELSPPTRDDAGVWRHRLRSPRQSGETQLRVLLSPAVEEAWRSGRESALRVPVVYLLPVEANRESRYGDPIRELLERKLHHRHRMVFAAPTFARLPWYADHPRQADSRQEAYFLDDILRLVEARYPVRAGRAGRYLLGFSKSGWGAWTLLLRHPDRFERAAAWDAPLMMDRPGPYGSGDIFGDDATFRRYEVSALLRQRASDLRGADPPRIILTGYGNFRGEHERTHGLLDELSVPHVYRDGPKRAHDWHSGWVAEALDLLVPKNPAP